MEDARPIGMLVAERIAQWPQRIRLYGRLVTVEPLNAKLHTDDLYESLGKKENAHLWYYYNHGPYNDKESFVKLMESNEESNDPMFYAIIDMKTKKAQGFATLMRIDIGNRVVETGNIMFSTSLQRTSAATEVMYLLAMYAFETLGFRRYEWKCHSLNAPSRRAAIRLGFQYEGTFRQHVISKGRNRDSCWYSIIDGEWPVVKSAMEQWLESSNFDNQGNQKLCLEDIRRSLLEKDDLKT